MPKKQPRNAFYFYMLDFKEEQRKKGINYPGLKEVAEAAGPLWTHAHPAVRKKFEEQARSEKQRLNMPENKFTSTGVSLAALEAAQKERRDAKEAERADIANFVKLKSVNNGIVDEFLYVMDVNCYCEVNGEHLVGEVALLRFSIGDGIKDIYHELINPGDIPVGYALDVKLGSQQLGLPMPDSEQRTNYKQVLAMIMDHLTGGAGGARGARGPLPFVYAMPDKVPAVLDFIQQLCYITGEDDARFRVYQLDTLLYHVASTADSAAMPKESVALMRLRNDPFKYSPDLGCEMHEAGERSTECSRARALRLAYTVLDTCCALLRVPVAPGKHLPRGTDLQGVISFREQKQRGRRAAPDALLAPPAADASCSLDESRALADCADDASGRSSRANPPLRMPAADYAQQLHAPPPLSDSDFPQLGSAGRGRGDAGSLGRLRLGE